jgi:hypothetical protein
MKRYYQQQNHERSCLRQKLNGNVFTAMKKKGDKKRTTVGVN